MHKPDFSLTVPFDRKNAAVCVIRQCRYPIQASRVEFPQGSPPSTSSEEPSASETALNELMEEAGIMSDTVHALGVLHEAYGFTDCRCHVFCAPVTSFTHPRTETFEQIEPTFWVNRDEFWDMVRTGEISDAPSIAAMALFLRSSFAELARRTVAVATSQSSRSLRA